MITELLRDAFGAALAAKPPDGSRDGLPDLCGTGYIGLLQRRDEQGFCPDGADAEVVHRWPHRGPPRQLDTSTTSRGYDIFRPCRAVGWSLCVHADKQDFAAGENSSAVALPGQHRTAGQQVTARRGCGRLEVSGPIVQIADEPAMGLSAGGP
jgi:hypothetical protein